MRSLRQQDIQRAVLTALDRIPAPYLMPEDLLLGDTARQLLPRPTVGEISHEIQFADETRRLSGLMTEEGMKYQITDAGRLWLRDNP